MLGSFFVEIEAEAEAVKRVTKSICPLNITLDRVILTSTGVIIGCWQVIHIPSIFIMFRDAHFLLFYILKSQVEFTSYHCKILVSPCRISKCQICSYEIGISCKSVNSDSKLWTCSCSSLGINDTSYHFSDINEHKT
jgi:hypothetical protein